MSGTSRTHGAQRSSNFLMPGTDMAEQYIITQLSFLQAWYHLFRLWVLSPTYTSKFGLCRYFLPFCSRPYLSKHRNAGLPGKLILRIASGVGRALSLLVSQTMVV